MTAPNVRVDSAAHVLTILGRDITRKPTVNQESA